MEDYEELEDAIVSSETEDVESQTTEEEETHSPDDAETDETVDEEESEETPEDEEEPKAVPYNRFKEVNEQLKAVAEVIYSDPQAKEAFIKAMRKKQGLETEETPAPKEEYEDFESEGERFLYQQNQELKKQLSDLMGEVRSIKQETQSDRAERVKSAFDSALKAAEKELGMAIPEESREGIAAIASSKYGSEPIPVAVKKAAKMIFAPIIKATKEKVDTVDRKKEGITRVGGMGTRKGTAPAEDYDDLDKAIESAHKSLKK